MGAPSQKEDCVKCMDGEKRKVMIFYTHYNYCIYAYFPGHQDLQYIACLLCGFIQMGSWKIDIFNKGKMYHDSCEKHSVLNMILHYNIFITTASCQKRKSYVVQWWPL